MSLLDITDPWDLFNEDSPIEIFTKDFPEDFDFDARRLGVLDLLLNAIETAVAYDLKLCLVDGKTGIEKVNNARQFASKTLSDIDKVTKLGFDLWVKQFDYLMEKKWAAFNFAITPEHAPLFLATTLQFSKKEIYGHVDSTPWFPLTLEIVLMNIRREETRQKLLFSWVRKYTNKEVLLVVFQVMLICVMSAFRELINIPLPQSEISRWQNGIFKLCRKPESVSNDGLISTLYPPIPPITLNPAYL